MPSTTVTGDVTITLSGKTIIGRVDPIETALQVVDNTGAVTSNYFHTFKPVYGGSPGVRLDPVNGNIVQYPVTSGGTTTTRNLPLDIYNSFVAGYGPPPLTRYPTALVTNNQGWFWNAPKAGAVWPNVGHAGGMQLDCQDRGGYTRQGDTSNNGTAQYTGGISPNDWGRQDSLPFTVITGDNRNANPGVPNYYLTATDLYPVGVLTEIYQFGNLLRRYSTEYDRVYVGNGGGAGGSESYIIDVQKTMDCTAVIQIPQTVSVSYPFGYSRGRNAIFNWDGRITATSTKITATGVSSPLVQEPIASGQDTTYRVGKRPLFRNTSDPNTSGRPYVPPPITASAIGDATFALDAKIGVFVQWQSANGAAIEVPSGATVDFGINFADGSYYSFISGTTYIGKDIFYSDQALLDPAPVDYWFGQDTALSKAVGTLRARVTFQDQTYPDGKHCPAFSYDSNSPQSGITYAITLQPAYTVQNPPIVIGNWTCNQPPTTIYSIRITGSPTATVAVGSSVFALDAHRRPIAARASGSGALGFYSNDGGHSFLGGTATGQKGVIDADASCASINLLLDSHTNRYRAIYSKGSPAGLYSAAGPVVDGFVPDVPIAAVAGLSGAYPIAASHPRDRLFCLMVYLDGTTLKAAWSGDGGGTWAVQSTIATGLSFTASGRAGLALLGETACVVYASGNTLLAKTSPDRGATWGAVVNAATAGPYSGLSLLGWQGRLSLLAFTGSPAAPKLLTSDDLGATWTNRSAGLPAVAAPSALGVIPHSGQLRLGTTHKSEDGAAWTVD